MPLREALKTRFRRVDITQRGVARVISVVCHVRKLGPRGGFGQIPLRKNKTVVLRFIFTIAFAFEHSSACGDSLVCSKS